MKIIGFIATGLTIMDEITKEDSSLKAVGDIITAGSILTRMIDQDPME